LQCFPPVQKTERLFSAARSPRRAQACLLPAHPQPARHAAVHGAMPGPFWLGSARSPQKTRGLVSVPPRVAAAAAAAAAAASPSRGSPALPPAGHPFWRAPDWREQLAGTVASLEARCCSLDEQLAAAVAAREAAVADAERARRAARQRERVLAAEEASSAQEAVRERDEARASAADAAAQLAAARAEWRTRAAWLDGERDLLAEARAAAAARADAAEARAAAAEARIAAAEASHAALPPPPDAPCAEAPLAEDGREEEAAALRDALAAERRRADAALAELAAVRQRLVAATAAKPPPLAPPRWFADTEAAVAAPAACGVPVALGRAPRVSWPMAVRPPLRPLPGNGA
jgi:hypothetical protein